MMRQNTKDSFSKIQVVLCYCSFLNCFDYWSCAVSKNILKEYFSEQKHRN